MYHCLGCMHFLSTFMCHVNSALIQLVDWLLSLASAASPVCNTASNTSM